MRFFVEGEARPKGSARAFMPKNARFPVVTNDNPKTKQWEQAIREAASRAGAQGDYVGPVYVRVLFLFARPKGDYTSAGAVKASAPTTHTKKPDLDKLARALLDGLRGACYVDDSQVIEITCSKRYARFTQGERIGADVEVTLAGLERPRIEPDRVESLFPEVADAYQDADAATQAAPGSTQRVQDVPAHPETNHGRPGAWAAPKNSVEGVE